MDQKKLLMEALNRNVAMFSNHANEVRELSNNLMRISFENVNKSIVFRFGNQIVRINLQHLAITGLK